MQVFERHSFEKVSFGGKMRRIATLDVENSGDMMLSKK